MQQEAQSNLPPPPDEATCLGCGYNLRGLPAQACPECGRAFDPADPASYRSANDCWLKAQQRIDNAMIWWLLGVIFAGVPLLGIVGFASTPFWELVLVADIFASPWIFIASIQVARAGWAIRGARFGIGILVLALLGSIAFGLGPVVAAAVVYRTRPELA